MAKKFFAAAISALLFAALAPLLRATTQTESVGGGTLTYTVTSSSGTCYDYSDPNDPLSWTEWDYSNFSFTDANGLLYNLSGFGSYTKLYGSAGYDSNCPQTGPTPSQITMPGFDFAITFNVCNGGGTCASSYGTIQSGDVNPKYVLATMVYAPPGPSSWVQYGSSSYAGDSNTIKSSMTQSTKTSTTVGWGGSIFAWMNGTIDYKSGNTKTTTQVASSTNGNSAGVTTSVDLSSFQKFYGTPVPWTGWWNTHDSNGKLINMHYYDQAILWLNPVLPMNTPDSSTVNWWGYGYDYCDQGPFIEIYQIQLGKLDPNSGWVLTTADLNALGRGWTASPNPTGCTAENFPSGNGALTGTDYAAIIAANPTYQQSYQLSLSGSTSADGRYTATAGLVQNGVIGPATDFPFVQPAGGAQPNVNDYTATYTDSMSIGKTTSFTNSQTWGMTQSKSGAFFGTTFQDSLTNSTTLSFTYQTQNIFTTTASRTASFEIVGPPCNWNGSSCNPSYAGPGGFDIFQDNIFGTFMFWPVS